MELLHNLTDGFAFVLGVMPLLTITVGVSVTGDGMGVLFSRAMAGIGMCVFLGVTMIGDRFVAVWESDAHHLLRIHGKDGCLEREVALPGLGSVTVSGKRRDDAFFYAYTSWAWPTTIYRCDPPTRRMPARGL